MKVAVILPSRGLMFSQTAEELLDNVKEVDHRWFFAHAKPLPDCFEEPTIEALTDKTITHLWFVEDDMKLPSNTLLSLLGAQAEAATCDYPVGKNKQGAVLRDKEGVVAFTGTGCLLVQREVFDKLKPPYFTDKFSWNIQNYGDHVRFTSSVNGSKFDRYGLHDVTFGLKLYSRGIAIVVVKPNGLVGQRKLVEMGKQGTNNGAHKIEYWTNVIPNLYMNAVKKWPVIPHGNLVPIEFPDGKVIDTSRTNAHKLTSRDMAKRVQPKAIVIDDEARALWNSL